MISVLNNQKLVSQLQNNSCLCANSFRQRAEEGKKMCISGQLKMCYEGYTCTLWITYAIEKRYN